SEVLQKISDQPIKKCPACGGKVHKLMSMNTFHLKGSGWYVTDYAGQKAPATKNEKAEKKPETKDSGASKDKSA
ncbi:MAG: zinc ribbon domain-containing protein, partial [Thermodesulfobacteriota bacterium]